MEEGCGVFGTRTDHDCSHCCDQHGSTYSTTVSTVRQTRLRIRQIKRSNKRYCRSWSLRRIAPENLRVGLPITVDPRWWAISSMTRSASSVIIWGTDQSQMNDILRNINPWGTYAIIAWSTWWQWNEEGKVISSIQCNLIWVEVNQLETILLL